MPEEQVRAAVASALEVVNMSPYMYRATHTLSGGQRQRVAIAGASLPLLCCFCGCDAQLFFRQHDTTHFCQHHHQRVMCMRMLCCGSVGARPQAQEQLLPIL